MKRLLLAGSIACATILFTAACGDDKKSDTPAAAPAASSAAPASADPAASTEPSGSAKASGAASGKAGELSFQTVGKLTGELFTKDPNCPVGQWGANSTGVDSKYRSAVADFKQFDCYKKKGDPMPSRVQQAIFVEFKSANAAKAYAQDQAKMHLVLLVGNTVVVAGSGLADTDMKAYLESVQETAGGAGQIAGKA